jgi:hypothetical protein
LGHFYILLQENYGVISILEAEDTPRDNPRQQPFNHIILSSFKKEFLKKHLPQSYKGWVTGDPLF